ncbi:MAG TPA: ATP-dependent helicase, partial [Chloroflexota bacterium]|nr:ATP-dependent helicase [Chloroflexota bacterium]
MHVVHGTWIPATTTEFVQQGDFHLWVETDAPTHVRRAHAVATLHPRQLAKEALAAFLEEKLLLRDPLLGPNARLLALRPFLLPSADGLPLPSFELLHYVDEEVPDQFSLAPWQVWCYQVPHLISTLNAIHFRALSGAEEFQLGADLLFWHQFTQALKTFIARDQYIPALKAREQAREQAHGKGRRGKEASHVDLYPGWEWLSDSYEAAIARYAAAMPQVCLAGLETPDGPGLFAPESLLRHCAENLLYQIVTSTPFTAKFEQQIADTMLYRCVFPGRQTLMGAAPLSLDDYRQWLVWRAKLAGAQITAGFTLCFRLQEAPPGDADDWQVHLLVAPRHDPSLKLSLAEYWQLNRAAKTEIQRQFGHDFEKQVLLALGYAARIYPKIWDGLDTSQPVGFRLTLDQAFDFLKES